MIAIAIVVKNTWFETLIKLVMVISYSNPLINNTTDVRLNRSQSICMLYINVEDCNYQ